MYVVVTGGIRRALFKLERGVCVVCGVDGHNLVKQLQQIGKDEPNWAATRRCIVAQHAPRFLERGYATYLDKLINQVIVQFRDNGGISSNDCGLQQLFDTLLHASLVLVVNSNPYHLGDISQHSLYACCGQAHMLRALLSTWVMFRLM